MKQLKPRNFVALALTKRGGAGAHVKSNKAKRSSDKMKLLNELRRPPTKLGGFLTPNSNYSFYYLIHIN